jgi:hypothetical protein
MKRNLIVAIPMITGGVMSGIMATHYGASPWLSIGIQAVTILAMNISADLKGD